MEDLHQTRHLLCNKKELARSLQAPTSADQQKLKHLLRYIKGIKHYKQAIRPTAKIPASGAPDINVYVDSDWAGCPTTRRSTTGFVITILGTTVSYGSRTQATVALSSAEAELYAINTGATEALYLRNLLKHQDSHRFQQWQKHGNTHWLFKKSQTH